MQIHHIMFIVYHHHHRFSDSKRKNNFTFNPTTIQWKAKIQQKRVGRRKINRFLSTYSRNRKNNTNKPILTIKCKNDKYTDFVHTHKHNDDDQIYTKKI